MEHSIFYFHCALCGHTFHCHSIPIHLFTPFPSNSSIHSFVSFFHPFIHSCVSFSSILSSIHVFHSHSFFHPFIHSCVSFSFILSSIHSFVSFSSILSSIHSFICFILIHSFICFILIHSSIHSLVSFSVIHSFFLTSINLFVPFLSIHSFMSLFSPFPFNGLFVSLFIYLFIYFVLKFQFIDLNQNIPPFQHGPSLTMFFSNKFCTFSTPKIRKLLEFSVSLV